MDEDDAAAFYLKEAEGCRAIASQIAIPIVVAILHDFARVYERKAELILSSPKAGSMTRRVRPHC